jgi:uncharacterized protein YwqG
VRLHSWLLVILGLAALAAASLPLWPPSLGVHAPSGSEAAMLAALGLGCLLIAGYFVRRDRRELTARQVAAAREALAAELIASGVIADFVESTRAECVRLAATRYDGADAFASKLGGLFYAPPGFAWPLTAQRQPMWPLAQLNFAELPHLDGFPDRGILQFFITGDDLYGMDLDDQTSQSGFRVVYHPTIDPITFPNPVQPAPDQLTLPFEGAFRITAQPGTMPMPASDWRFEQAVTDSWRRRRGSEPGPDVARAAYQVELDAADDEEGVFAGHLGGYASFTQEDPRGYTERLRGHTTVLLQIESVGDICWGDVGVASFLIEPDRLRRGDFSHVLYTWDCH